MTVRTPTADEARLVKAIWQMPPTESNGEWFARWEPCVLPLHIARMCEQSEQCIIVRHDGRAVDA